VAVLLGDQSPLVDVDGDVGVCPTQCPFVSLAVCFFFDLFPSFGLFDAELDY